jgi:hypothetical protein
MPEPMPLRMIVKQDADRGPVKRPLMLSVAILLLGAVFGTAQSDASRSDRQKMYERYRKHVRETIVKAPSKEMLPVTDNIIDLRPAIKELAKEIPGVGRRLQTSTSKSQKQLKEYSVLIRRNHPSSGINLLQSDTAISIELCPDHARATAFLVQSIADHQVGFISGTASGLKVGQYSAYSEIGTKILFVRANAWVSVRCTRLSEFEALENGRRREVRTLSTPEEDANRCDSVALQIDQELQRQVQQQGGQPQP